MPRESVLHPVDIITVGVVLTGVSTSRLLTGDSRVGSLHGASEQVLELKGLNKVRVPDHGSVLGGNILESAGNISDSSDTILKRLLGSEDGNVSLHDLLHGESNLGSGEVASGSSQVVEVLNGLLTNVSRRRLMSLARSELGGNVESNGTAKDDKIEERVGTETVSTVDRDTGRLTAGVETGNNSVLALSVLSKSLTSPLGGDTTHIVVDSGDNGNGLLGDIDTGENGGGLRDTGETLVENGCGEMGELEVDVVILGADTTAVTDLHSHGSGNDISGGQILGGGSISLHETLTILVQKETTFTTGALGNETARAIDTGRVELHKLQVLERETSTGDHGKTVTGTGVGRSAGEVGSSVTTGSNNSVLSLESVESTILLVVREDTHALAVLHQEIESKELNEEVGVVSEGLTVKGVEQGMAGTVSDSTGSVGLATLTVFLGLTTKGSLVDSALFRSGEGNTVVLKLDNGLGSFSSHVVDGILVTKPVGTLDSVVHVPVPVVLVHVTESGIDTTLSGDRVGAGREELGDAGSVEASLGQTEGGTETGTTGTNDDSIIFVVYDGVLLCEMLRGFGSLDMFLRNNRSEGSGDVERSGCGFELSEGLLLL